MTILVMHGPNLNWLGRRDKKIYGTKTLDEIQEMLHNDAKQWGIKLLFFQSNHEGDLIDYIQKHHFADGIIINPGALTHYSYALADALRDFQGIKAEVHLSDIKKREKFRAISVTKDACDTVIMGKKDTGYREALAWIRNALENRRGA